MKEIALMFSGGTDSTAAAALLAAEPCRIHLVTFKHSGLARIENSRVNVQKLGERFGGERFVHVIEDIDRLFKLVTYDGYLRNLRQYGFFNLTTCGFCKLAMHLRTLIYALDAGITEVADGANRNMSHFPAQMEDVIVEIRKMYGRFGIAYVNPVFEYDFPDDIDWFHKLGLAALVGGPRTEEDAKKGVTTGQVLFDRGILEEENVKGSPTDRRMQARCFQLTLLNVFALGYYIPRHGMESYRKTTARFYREKIEAFIPRIEEYLRKGHDSELYRALQI